MKKSKITASVVPAGLKPEARKLLEEACDLFESGERSKSIELLLAAAKKGSREAQVNIANIYDEGDGVKASFEKARYWYKRATRGGSSEAAYNLGISYLSRGDVRWARHWLHIAKSMGDEDAKEKLNTLNI